MAAHMTLVHFGDKLDPLTLSEIRGPVPLWQVLQGEILFPTCWPVEMHLEQGLKQRVAGSNNTKKLNKNLVLSFWNGLYMSESSFK